MTDMDAWVEEARAVDIGSVAAFLNLKLKGRGEMKGPCPVCAGTDRFSVNTKNGLFYCRGCAKGGDAIALAMHAIGCDFIAACEAITGKQSPRGSGKSISAEDRARMHALAEAKRAERDAKDLKDRMRRHESAGVIWGAAQ